MGKCKFTDQWLQEKDASGYKIDFNFFKQVVKAA